MRTLLRFLAVLALAAGLLGVLSKLRDRPEAVESPCVPDQPRCQAGDPAAHEVEEAWTASIGERVTHLEGAAVCPDAGYLCAGLEQRGTWRVLRWDENTSVIRVRVPLPPGEDRGRARALQNAAARGIRAWHRHPFPIRVELSDLPGEHDIVVRWSDTLPGTELGHASTRWRRSGKEISLLVDDFSLATRSPFNGHRPLDPRDIELTAAHEMGHALGLPHSDRESDVMFPTNTATRLTARDFRTMEALYVLENGAQISRP